ncbi:MAG: uncharacterized protein C75L2_00380165 [Leptospirillum sp. Group II 'C75']|jgi:uncharacterized protein YbcC (UPF0753/DUF2309 family)|uniref:YbcC family protein n=1 Tax=Leptospirillum sp. Group II 'CF-1' TaxID=1660083 RepID=UPI00029CAD77|nr:DUF2309 domain-containing protein [Leptospirillum sp. Group II 'CF-1']AKS23930.1 hypothetical protein ABH19_09590 [Leptospirillum sp. Group II 'CF-1']EIJ76800.1 MAG: uncharacterized protein C75L2_00380165 [Leptospirillum sp. Group II 'C75']
MNNTAGHDNTTSLSRHIEAACQRIAPLWPLRNFVAVNPYFGLGDRPFWQAGQLLERMAGKGLTMPRAYYREQIGQGRIQKDDLEEALRALGSPWNLPAFEREMAQEKEANPVRIPLLSDVLGSIDRRDWSQFVVERMSQFCAAFFDEGQAMWPFPWKKSSFYTSWLEYAALDKSAWMMGLRGMTRKVRSLPRSPEGAIAWALDTLGIPPSLIVDYFHAALLSIGGWAGWARYQRWQAELGKRQDGTIREILAVRVVWDALLYTLRSGPFLEHRWQEALSEMSAFPSPADPARDVDAVLQTALEIGYQKSLIRSLCSVSGPAATQEQSLVQAVFCIDVRSEIFRRALETVSPSIRTHGFAGFFGVLVEFQPFGADSAKGHLPILFNPSYRVEEVPSGVSKYEATRLASLRHHRIRSSNAWKGFKTSAASCFSFVESFGILSIGKLLGDSFGWSRTVKHPDRKGLKEHEYDRMTPSLGAERPGSGIPEADRPAVAEFALRNMGLTGNFARLVLLVGHGSTTVNNPQATALDCGACAGQTGEASARIAAFLLNDPVTRRGLAQKGIVIPEETWFVAGLHDTTTDMVALYDKDTLPPSHDGDIRHLEQWLEQAGRLTRMERSVFLGTGDLSSEDVFADVRRRTRDWSEVRPEWALAGNAAFIAAPRSRTASLNLGGRAFLHDYDWQRDKDFATLQLIMTAPMVVGNWINMQYYGSMVDNLHFGSGNKVLHNVVGGSIGVLEGNGGDLRTGLAIQSLHDGHRWIHEPLRLNVVIEAPQEAIDDVIARHTLVRDLIENEWLFFFRIGEDQSVYQRKTNRTWEKMCPDGK